MIKRLIVDDDYNWVDITTGMRLEIEDAFDLVNELHEEKEHCKKLYEQMAYYFRDDLQLFNLDHKDFQALKRLSRGDTMTENKRFNIIKNDLDCWFDITDELKEWEIGDVEEDNLPCFETLVDLLNELYEENSKLHIENDFLQNEHQHFKEILKENKELEKRNNRQAKQLNNLYNLIEKQDWKTLTEIITEFQECEEQLQREYRCVIE